MIPRITCAHCGESVVKFTLHARLSAGPREEHDGRIAAADRALAIQRACYDRAYAHGVIRRAAATRGATFR